MAREQEYVSMLYGRLDELRERTSARLSAAFRNQGGSQHRQALAEREDAAAMYADRLAALNAAEHGLCFGRLDLDDGEHRYVGRLGIVDESDDYEPLLLDWRAPAARPFYVATPASPGGVRRRRHIKTRNRDVIGLEDEILDFRAAEHSELTGEAALLATLDAGRTGRMGDIVETIQAEQDQVIRADHRGVLVAQGGPGTGKTVVALHRAAYLLYTYREMLAKRGVLIVGPTSTFLQYIGEVLPALGETGVLLSTIGDLYPGVSARATESAGAAELKGRLAMSRVVHDAVRDRQWIPDEAMDVVFQRETLRLDRRSCARARQRARDSLLPHNEARSIVAREVVDALARQAADRLGDDPYANDPLGGDDAPGEDSNLLDESDVEQIRRELAGSTDVRAAIDALWPVLTPQGLLTELFSSAERISRAAPELPQGQRELLLRPRSSEWTPADVPLLDEAAELVGDDDRTSAAAAQRSKRERIAKAQDVLDTAFGSRSTDLEVDEEPEILTATDLVDAEQLADRHEDVDTRTTVQRAAADRTWAFGHVIVDEAQELSEMAWRMLMRRCPSRSMTVVGDVAQTGDPAGISSWQRALEPYQGSRWRLRTLTLNYRTPAEIMTVAANVLAELDSALEPPRSVRHTGVEPWQLDTGSDELPGRLAQVVADEAAAMEDGRLAVIVPASRREEIGRAVAAAVPSVARGRDPDLEEAVVVLDVRQAKGLEFDSVLVADPARIVGESPRGHSDLYVALTRSTQRLGIVHAGDYSEAMGNPVWAEPFFSGAYVPDQGSAHRPSDDVAEDVWAEEAEAYEQTKNSAQ